MGWHSQNLAEHPAEAIGPERRELVLHELSASPFVWRYDPRDTLSSKGIDASESCSGCVHMRGQLWSLKARRERSWLLYHHHIRLGDDVAIQMSRVLNIEDKRMPPMSRQIDEVTYDFALGTLTTPGMK